MSNILIPDIFKNSTTGVTSGGRTANTPCFSEGRVARSLGIFVF